MKLSFCQAVEGSVLAGSRGPGCSSLVTSCRVLDIGSKKTGYCQQSRHGIRVGAATERNSVSVPPPLRTKAAVRDIIMVDPVVAKRMAEEDMVRRNAAAKAQKQREVEAINGAFAVLGLTAGLIVEGANGKGIIEQVSAYFDSLSLFFSGLLAL